MKAKRACRWCLIAMVVAAAFGVLLVARSKRNWGELICASQLKTIGLALAVYANDHDGSLPADMDQFGRITEYGFRRSIDGDLTGWGPHLFHCPRDGEHSEPISITNWDLNAPHSSRISYDCRLAYEPMDDAWDGGEPLMWDIDGGDPNSPRTNHPHGKDTWGNVLYLDGRVRQVVHSRWPEASRPPRAEGAWPRLIGVAMAPSAP